MRFLTTAVALALCLGCVVDREIGAGFGTGDLTTTPGTGPSPTRLAPPPPSSDPCCVVRQQMALDDTTVDRQASPPSIVAHDPGRWAVTWQELEGKQPVIRMVEGDTPGALLRLSPPAPDVIPTDIEHFLSRLTPEDRRFAVVMRASPWLYWPEVYPNAHVVLVDQQGAMRAQTAVEGGSEGGAIVRSPALRALGLVVLHDPEGSVDQARLLLLDDNLHPVGGSVALGPSLQNDSFGPSVLAVADRLVTVIAAPDGVHVRSFVGRALAEPHSEVVIHAGTTTDPNAPRGRDGQPMNPTGAVGSVSATVVWDRVIIAVMDRLTVRTWVYDPATGALLGGPFVVGSSTHHGRLNMGGDTAGGSAGLCYSVGNGPGDPDGLQFALVGPDGRPRGLPVTVASGLRYVATCDVAAGGVDEYLVALWNAAKTTPRPSILASRILVQRAQGIVE